MKKVKSASKKKSELSDHEDFDVYKDISNAAAAGSIELASIEPFGAFIGAAIGAVEEVKALFVDKHQLNDELGSSDKSGVIVSAIDAIYARRAVRNFTLETIDKTTIHKLIDAAIHAPTAMHMEPWAFVVIQDRDMLNRLSETAKEIVRREAKTQDSMKANQALDLVNKPDFHVFHNAGTLIVIYGKQAGPFVTADCWLAAENLMIAACANELGTCVIGFAVSALNTPQWKSELGIPVEMTAIAPIIVGAPSGKTSLTSRKPAEILAWK